MHVLFKLKYFCLLLFIMYLGMQNISIVYVFVLSTFLSSEFCFKNRNTMRLFLKSSMSSHSPFINFCLFENCDPSCGIY